MIRVIDTVFALFHFHFAGTANTDNSDAAREFRKTFLQFFAVVIGRGFFDLRLDLANACIDVRFRAHTVNDGGVIFADADFLGRTQHIEGHVFKFDAEVFGDDLTVGQDRHIFEHGFTTIAKALELSQPQL